VRGIMTIGQEIELWRKRAEKAYDKGEQAGVERGSAQREQEIARNLIALGLPTEQIIKATGLSPEEIERLKQSQS
jgi:predicted transposase/invertase (TIGR01784 family)